MVEKAVSPRWFLFCFVTFYFWWIFKWRKKPGLWRKQSLQIFQTAYVRKVRSRAQPGLICRPSGQPGSRESWPTKRASVARGESSAWREKTSRYALEAARDSEPEVVWGATSLFKIRTYLATKFYFMNLAPTFNKGNILALCLPGSVYWESKLGNSSDEALNASSLQFFASVKPFIASLLNFLQ